MCPPATAQTIHVGAVAYLRKVAADEWDLYGDLQLTT